MNKNVILLSDYDNVFRLLNEIKKQLNYCKDIFYKVFSDDKSKLTIEFINGSRRNSTILTINKDRNKVIVDHLEEPNPTAFNIGKPSELVSSYHFEYIPEEGQINFDKVTKCVSDCLMSESNYDRWIKAGGVGKIKVHFTNNQTDTNQLARTLHETDVVAIDIKDTDYREQVKTGTVKLTEDVTLKICNYPNLSDKVLSILNRSVPCFLVFNKRLEANIFSHQDFLDKFNP